MLTLICGPSGVGKSTLINLLSDKFHWNIIPTYTTRRSRSEDSIKMSISEKEFEHLRKKGFFLCINTAYGYSYGTPAREIIAAANSEIEYWVMDFPITRIQSVFQSIAHRCVVVLPENREQLRKQLASCGREDRIKDSIEDLQKNHTPCPKNSNCVFWITNRFNQAEETAFLINKLIKE